MILHLMASFRTHFTLKDEEVLASQNAYLLFWQNVNVAPNDFRANFQDVIHLHKHSDNNPHLSRFRSVETDSLQKPLHILEFHISAEDKFLDSVWKAITDISPKFKTILNTVSLIKESVTIRVYNNSIALLQADIDVSDLAHQLATHEIAAQLDQLQEFGVTFGEQLARVIYSDRIYPYLHNIINTMPNADRFILTERFNYSPAALSAVLTYDSTIEKQTVRVNWVTRSLLIEDNDEDNTTDIIAHWLKDSGDPQLIKDTQNNADMQAIRWLNYIFREQSYSWQKKQDGTIDYATAFSDEWQAMLNAQYYYAAFEALNDSLTTTLAHSYRKSDGKTKKNTATLRKLGQQLEQDVITANLVTLEYHNNYAYYKRKIGNTMRAIMTGWDFDTAILKEVTRKTELCEQRINELHKKADSRSGFYSDLLLLGIALISISAFLFQIIEYGRTMTHNAELAVYESNTWNLITFISERPTDFIITLSFSLIIILFGLYAWFRRLKVMD